MIQLKDYYNEDNIALSEKRIRELLKEIIKKEEKAMIGSIRRIRIGEIKMDKNKIREEYIELLDKHKTTYIMFQDQKTMEYKDYYDLQGQYNLGFLNAIYLIDEEFGMELDQMTLEFYRENNFGLGE